MGRVTVQSWADWVPDAEFIDATVTGTGIQDWDYTSMSDGSHIVTSGSSFIGMAVCLDGSFTGQNCAGYVNATNVTRYYSGHYVTKLTEVGPSNGSSMCQDGDSGGPAYTGVGYLKLSAYGTISAGNGAGTDCYYSELTDELNALGAGLVAG
jgi:hypothetical protein